MARSETYGRFTEFWPFYLSEHSKKATRLLHFVGSTSGIIFFGAALASGRPSLVVAGLVTGYAFAWVGHFFVEKNRPATFKYPLRSFAADFKMWAYMVSGKLDRELDRFGIR